MLERLVIGLQEPVLIKNLGEITAKIDSGNGGFNVIHGTDFVMQGDVLLFKTKNNKGEIRQLSKKVVDYIDVNIGGGNIQHRPVIELDIKFADTNYKKVKFSVTDRGSNDTLILISKAFVQDELDALIDVSGVNLTQDGKIEAEIISEGKFGEQRSSNLNTPGDNGSLTTTKSVRSGSKWDTFAKTTNAIKNGVDTQMRKAQGVMHKLAFGGNYGLSDLIWDLPTSDKVKEFWESLKLDQYYATDKKLIIAQCNREANILVNNHITIKDGDTNLIDGLEIRKLIDFTGNGWDDDSTKIFRGEAPYDKLAQEAQDYDPDADEELNGSNNFNTDASNPADSGNAPAENPENPGGTTENESEETVLDSYIREYTSILSEATPTPTPTPPTTAPTLPAGDDDDDDSDPFKNKTEAYKEFATTKYQELKEQLDKTTSLAKINKLIQIYKNEVDQNEKLTKPEKSLLKNKAGGLYLKYTQKALDNTSYFIVYYTDIKLPKSNDKDTERILREKILTPDIKNKAVEIFSNPSDVRSSLDTFCTKLCDNYHKANGEGLNGLFAVCTGDIKNRKCKLYIANDNSEPSAGKPNEESDTDGIDLDSFIDNLMQNFSLPEITEDDIGNDEESDTDTSDDA